MLSQEDRAAFKRIDSGQVSDAMESLGLPRAVIVGLGFIQPIAAPIVGPAVTLRQIAKDPGADRAARLVRHGELADLAKPGDVVLIDAGGRLDIATWGENHSRRCQARGVEGALIHGAARDLAAIRRLGFPVACRGASPIKGQWDLQTAAINQPVEIAGITVRPGDILFADEDGVLAIAAEHYGAVLAKATEVRGREEARRGRAK